MSGSMPFSEMAEVFAKALSAIKKTAATNLPPFIAGIYKDASVRIILDGAES